MLITLLLVLIQTANADLASNLEDSSGEVVSGSGKQDLMPADEKSDLQSLYNFKTLQINLQPLSSLSLCKMFFGPTAKSGKKFPVENSDSLLVINCYKKGSRKVKQIPLQKNTMETLDKLRLNEKCKASSPLHNFEFAEITNDKRSPNDLYARYFPKKPTPLSLTCRQPIKVSSSQPPYKEKSRAQLIMEVLTKQIEEQRRQMRIKESTKNAKTTDA